MFTLDQIQLAHSKVKSGADFPIYIQEIKQLGVINYVTFVSDGYVDYYGSNNFKITSPEKYSTKTISLILDLFTFKTELLYHQQGKTDYLTFINMCADSGIKKWSVNIEKLTCSYFDIEDNIILTEQIPH